MALITCQDLALGYENTRVAEHLSFTVEEGDYLCIVGENGSGKSTLMKTLLGLRAPLAGRITFGDGLRKNEIGYLPQQTPVQRDFPASVQEVVLSGCLNRCGLRPFYSKAERALAAPFAVRGWGRETLDGSLGLHVYHSAQDFVDCLRGAVLDEATRTRQEAAGRAYAEARFGFEGFARQVRVGLGENPAGR